MLAEVKFTMQLLGWDVKNEEHDRWSILGMWNKGSIPETKLKLNPYTDGWKVLLDLCQFKREKDSLTVWVCEDLWEMQLYPRTKEHIPPLAGTGLEEFCQALATLLEEHTYAS